jgi:hypothetical protein
MCAVTRCACFLFVAILKHVPCVCSHVHPNIFFFGFDGQDVFSQLEHGQAVPQAREKVLECVNLDYSRTQNVTRYEERFSRLKKLRDGQRDSEQKSRFSLASALLVVKPEPQNLFIL